MDTATVYPSSSFGLFKYSALRMGGCRNWLESKHVEGIVVPSKRSLPQYEEWWGLPHNARWKENEHLLVMVVILAGTNDLCPRVPIPHPIPSQKWSNTYCIICYDFTKWCGIQQQQQNNSNHIGMVESSLSSTCHDSRIKTNINIVAHSIANCHWDSLLQLSRTRQSCCQGNTLQRQSTTLGTVTFRSLLGQVAVPAISILLFNKY